MTDRIDLDDLETGDESEDEPDANPGDWIWRGEGSPENEPDPERVAGPAVRDESGEAEDENEGEPDAETADRTASESTSDPAPAPRVPSSTAGKPAGVPTEQGGAGAGTGAGSAASGSGPTNEPSAEPRPAGSAAEGPHGGGVDDMTLAFTYDALQRVAHPAAVFADANRWADWLGIVGDVQTHRITKFQRTHGVDADFFTGSGTSPADRLREIDRTSMFYAERMVVVGVDEADEAIAEAADWEFVPLETAAEKADWELQQE